MSCKFRKNQEGEDKRECPLCKLKDSPMVELGLWMLSGMNLIFAMRSFIKATIRFEDYLDGDFEDDDDYDEEEYDD